jgi:hypothetical protein
MKTVISKHVCAQLCTMTKDATKKTLEPELEKADKDEEMLQRPAVCSNQRETLYQKINEGEENYVLTKTEF